MRGKALSIGAVLLIGMLLMAYRYQNDIRGTYLTDINSLATTNGTIVSSSVFTIHPWIGWRDSSTDSYAYAIYYEFEVDSRTFRSDQVTFSSRESNDRRYAERYVEKYPVGRRVTVFYDQHHPAFSVLEPDVKNERLIGLIIGIGLSAAVCGFILVLNFANAIAYQRQRRSKLLR